MMTESRLRGAIVAGVLGAFAGLAAGQGTTVVTFDEGDTQGWTGPTGLGGTSWIDYNGGNGAPSYHTVFNNFGITFANSTNPAFVQDYTQWSSVTFSIDIKVNSIAFFGGQVERSWVLELRDYDNVSTGYPYASVWIVMDTISSATHGDWTTLSVTIDNPLSADLLPGWGGYGDENEFIEPILPADRTFASILAGVDEMVFTTYEPGWVYGFTDFDIEIDNIRVTTVPAPAGVGLLAGAGLLGARRRR